MTEATKTGNKNRKWGRNARSPSMARYNQVQRWTTNKKKRIVRHLKSHRGDKQARQALFDI